MVGAIFAASGELSGQVGWMPVNLAFPSFNQLKCPRRFSLCAQTSHHLKEAQTLRPEHARVERVLGRESASRFFSGTRLLIGPSLMEKSSADKLVCPVGRRNCQFAQFHSICAKSFEGKIGYAGITNRPSVKIIVDASPGLPPAISSGFSGEGLEWRGG